MKLLKILPLLLALAPTVALACPGENKSAATKATHASYALVSLDELSKWVDQKAANVYDANNAERYAKGHIPGAVHVTHDAVSESVLPVEKDTKVVFYCAAEQCSASTMAAEKALDLGYTQVFIFKPGIRGWEKAGKRVETAALPVKKPVGEG